MSAVLDRLFKKTKQNGECIEWTGYLDKEGYGRTSAYRKDYLAHRLMYAELVGQIPEGKVLDHTCFNRKCVNPKHLEPVTQEENTRRSFRKKHTCKHGHAFDANNTYWWRGRRACRTCRDGHSRRYQSRRAV